MVLFKNFDERGVAYEAIFWHHDPNVYILRRDEIGHALWYAFRRAGIPISVHRRLLAMPEAASPVFRPDDASDDHARLLGHLRRLPLTACFPDAELTALVPRARFLLFATGERIFHTGEPGDSMFVILDGGASVRLEDAAGVEQEIYALGAGEVFGHMSALTGAPRLATVRAVGHLRLAEIDGATLAPLIERHPGIVDSVAREMLRIETAHDALRQAAMPDMAASKGAEHGGLLDRVAERIRAYLGREAERGGA
jgi:CRP-like cAMP-binding protein